MNISELKSHTFFDTDLQIFRHSIDPPVREAAESEFKISRPSAMSAFSLVELKGNFVQDLILLRRKIDDSESLEEAYSRSENTGGRKSKLMLMLLIKFVGGYEFPINPWKEAKNYLLTILDSQIESVWQNFRTSVDLVINDFQCSRADEDPEDDGLRWHATIPHCNKDNVKCNINKFIMHYINELKNLREVLVILPKENMTNELYAILNVITKTISDTKYPWEGSTCRKIGDLLIGLQSKSGKEIVSSNHKEHVHLHGPLDYNFREFPISKLRSK